VKIWNLQETTLEKLIERDLKRQPKSLPVPPIRRDWSLSADYGAIAIKAKAAIKAKPLNYCGSAPRL